MWAPAYRGHCTERSPSSPRPRSRRPAEAAPPTLRGPEEGGTRRKSSCENSLEFGAARKQLSRAKLYGNVCSLFQRGGSYVKNVLENEPKGGPFDELSPYENRGNPRST